MSSPPQQATENRRILAEVIHPTLSVFDDSGTRERRSQLAGRIGEYIIVTAVVLLVCGIELAHWYFKQPPNPLIFVITGLLVAGYAAVRIFLIVPQMKTLTREQESRASLRSALQEVCSRGYVLFDGLKDRRGHLLGSVLAGPGGLFTLVPRFIPRGSDLRETIDHVDDQTVEVGGRTLIANPIGQARMVATALFELLAAESLETIPVQPVVIFPGWKIGIRPTSGEGDVLVWNDLEIPEKMAQVPVVLDAKHLIAVSLVLEKLHSR